MMFRIFLTNLGKYNEGELVGKWVDLPCGDFETELKAIGVSDEPDENGAYYEEFFITDYENDYNVSVDEYENLDELNDIAERLEGLDEYDQMKLEAYCEAVSNDVLYALDHIDDFYFYANMTLEDVAAELFDECYSHDIPDCYIDYRAFARDLRFDGYTETEHGVVCAC